MGKVASVNINSQYVIVSFSPGELPKPDACLNIYRNGLKVAEVKLDASASRWPTTGPADILTGNVQVGDEARQNGIPIKINRRSWVLPIRLIPASPDHPMIVDKYKLVAAPINELEDKVNQLIQAGWQPFGAPFLLPAKADDLTLQQNKVYQAMVLAASQDAPSSRIPS